MNTATELFHVNGNYLLGKKTEPTKIRKAIPWEVIETYVKNSQGQYVPEWDGKTAKQWDYIFQDVNDPMDTWIPTNFDMSEYEAMNEWGEYTEEFDLFVRKSEPSKVLPAIIEKPTLLIVKAWDNDKQFLDTGATLKLEWDEVKWYEVTWINKWGFEAWSIVDEQGWVVNTKTSVKDRVSKVL